MAIMQVPFGVLARDVMDKQIGSVGFSGTQTLIKDCVSGFGQLCEEPALYQRQFTFNVDGRFNRDGSEDPDDGFLRREGIMRNDRPDDQKWIFHYRPHLIPLLQARGTSISEGYWRFLHKCQDLFEICEWTATHCVDALHRVLPWYDFEKRIREPDTHESSVLRLQFYDDTGGENIEIGKPHWDISFISLHIADSWPGLRVGEKRILTPSIPGRVLVFAGNKAEVITDGVLKSLYHLVTDERQAGESGKRWSIVFFSHIKLSPAEEEKRAKLDSDQKRRLSLAA